MSISLSPKINLEWPDYAIIGLILILCVALSIYFKQNKKRSQQGGNQLSEFLLATRSLSVVPVACSIAATLISAISLTANTSEFYKFGFLYAIHYFSIAFGMVLIAYYVVPLYRKSQYVSVFQLVEERFDSCIRRFFSVIFIASKLFQMALVLYLPALSLATLTPFNTQITTFVLGFVCTCYSSLGGFRTVVWTDAIQCVLMMSAALMIIIQGIIRTGGGLRGLWKTSMDNGYLTTIFWLEGDNVRYSIWAVIMAGLISSFDNFLINQATIQRVLSVRSNFAARGSVILASLFVLLIGAALAGVGATLYMLYGKCDPNAFPEYTGVSKSDQIFVYAIGDLFQNHVILKGVAVSGIISASLSTFSSFINAFAALALEDFLKPLFPNFLRNDSVSVKLCMALSFAFGALATFTSLLMPYMGNVVKIYGILSGIFLGPLSGIALLVLFYKRLTKMACLTALLMGMLLVSWLILGNAMYVKNRYFYSLSHTTIDCEIEYEVTKGNTTLNMDFGTEGILMPFYKISFLWYGSFGFAASIIFGFALTEISRIIQGRNQKIYTRVKTGFQENGHQPMESLALPVL